MTVDKVIKFSELKWDENFFGITSAQAILYNSLTATEWNNLMGKFSEFEFVSIVNRNSIPTNTQMIGKTTPAFLVDVNVQFIKILSSEVMLPEDITIQEMLERNDEILKIANFPISKFTEDPELAKRGGHKVYHKWLVNSFKKKGKFYALYKNKNGKINGFVLFSYQDNICVIELIAVSETQANVGIGKKLFRAVEYAAWKNGCMQINVGTQLRNIAAINFYNKVGCKQIACHQIYHLWNL